MSTSDEDSEALEGVDEVEKAKKMADLMKKEAKKSGKIHTSASTIEDSLAELNMDAYDDDDADEDMNRILGGGNPGMAYYANPDDDPYFSKDNQADDQSDSESMEFRESDLLIAAARNEEDISHLEIWVYEEADEHAPDGNIYVHHSLLLPAFPLCVAWGSCDPLSGDISGNFMAVGSFEPGIEIWNLDMLDTVEPTVTLGGADYEAARKVDSKKKKKKNKSPPEIPVKEGSHKDAVLGLAWNQEFCNVLASGSADCTIKIWDITTQKSTQTMAIHSDKVQAVKWRPVESSLLLSGGFDKNIFLSDLRNPEKNAPHWSIIDDVEAIAWDPHQPHSFAVASEDGSVTMFDTRRGSEPIEHITAHSKATTSISFCPCLKGVFITGSTDATVKLWRANKDGKHEEISCQQNMGVGAVFTAEYCRDSPMLVAVGGANGCVSVWDTSYA
jgi:periodic tryptophan protein 1